jgi:hypothetical protein
MFAFSQSNRRNESFYHPIRANCTRIALEASLSHPVRIWLRSPVKRAETR